MTDPACAARANFPIDVCFFLDKGAAYTPGNKAACTLLRALLSILARRHVGTTLRSQAHAPQLSTVLLAVNHV